MPSLKELTTTRMMQLILVALILCSAEVVFAGEEQRGMEKRITTTNEETAGSASEANIVKAKRHAVGSWFGRAVPIDTICPPGAPGCPVPKEVVMLLTINKDGTIIATNSSALSAAAPTTAHGQWMPDLANGIRGELTLLLFSPEGTLRGGLKDVFNANMPSQDEMQGTLDRIFYSFASAPGDVIVDGDGFPLPNPLDPPTACATTPGCLEVGQFSFILRRVAVH